MNLLVGFDNAPKGSNWSPVYIDRAYLAKGVNLSEGATVVRCETDGSYAILAETPIYAPMHAPSSSARKAMEEFAERQVDAGDWLRIYIAPKASLQYHMSDARSEAERRGAASSSPGVSACVPKSRLASVSSSRENEVGSTSPQDRLSLSQTSGTTDDPSRQTPRTTLPPMLQGSNTTSPDSSVLVIGHPHPHHGGLVYHYTDNPEALSTSIERSLPNIETILASIENRVPGSELKRDEKGSAVKHNKQMYGRRPASNLSDLLTATLGLHHEGQADEALKAVMDHTRGVSKDIVSSDPYGAHFLAHHVSIPVGSGTSVRLRIVPKEMMPVVDKIDSIASSGKDWGLQKMIDSKNEIAQAIESAYDAHRNRAYASSPVDPDGLSMQGAKLSESYDRIYVDPSGPFGFDDSGYKISLSERYVASNSVMVQYAESRKMILVDALGRPI